MSAPRHALLFTLAATLALPACGEPVPDPGTLPPSSLKLLRSFEYRNTVDDLFEGKASVDPAALPEDLVRANFSAISASMDCYSDVSVESFELIALDLAAQAFAASPTPLDSFGCAPSNIQDPCILEFLNHFGQRAWRRPLTTGELNRYAVLAANIAELYDDDPERGVELAVAGLLQSPNFLYRVELGMLVDPEGFPNTRKYDDFEMASRLAYTLWETMPDEELFEAAERGKLVKPRGLRKQVRRMLEDPRAKAGLARFWSEHLNIGRLSQANYPKPDASEELYAAMRAEGEAMIDSLLTEGTDAMNFLTMPLSPSETLADHYRSSEGTDVRRGYLTSGVFLATNGHPNKTSPTRRGKFVIERILCEEVPPPPPNVDTSLPPVPEDEPVTLRDVLEAHRNDPSCAGCHVIMDPPGYAFEHYDALGRYRSLDNGQPVDASGYFRREEFDDAEGFIALLAAQPDTSACLTRQVYRHTLGQFEEPGQEGNITMLDELFNEEGRDFRALMFELLTSDAFRYAHGFVGDEHGEDN